MAAILLDRVGLVSDQKHWLDQVNQLQTVNHQPREYDVLAQGVLQQALDR